MRKNELKKQIHIKRANTDWWLNEKSVVGANGKTYITYITDMGEIHVKEIDAKCSKSESKDVRIKIVNSVYADEHNAPSLCILQSGRIIVTYTGHNQGGELFGKLFYRITKNPYDLNSFGEEKYIDFKNAVSYCQIFENEQRNEIWVFCRVAGTTWQFCYSKDEGETWEKSKTFLSSDAGGLYYCDVRKLYVANRENVVKEQWFFAIYGHPYKSKDHTIHSGIFDADGFLLDMNGTKQKVCLFEENGLIEIDNLNTVYSPQDNSTVRLLDVAPTLPYRVGFASFIMNEPKTIVYKSATFKNGKYAVSDDICRGGEFLANGVHDGSESYIGGMAYYYGVGEAGLSDDTVVPTDTNRIYIARLKNRNRVLESYVSKDNGKNYVLEKVIRKIPKRLNIKIWRPIVPIHAQDNLSVYWHEGIYNSYMGGWHCEVVADVEYDD